MAIGLVLIVAFTSYDIQQAIQRALNTLGKELVERKKTYFNTSVPPGKNWSSLTQSTLATKRSYAKNGKMPTENINKFNIQTGDLKNSLEHHSVTTDDGFGLYISAQHRKGDEVIAHLIDTLGRDFLNIDVTEMEWCRQRFAQLLQQELS